METTQIVLSLNLDDKAVEGPGWYIYGLNDGQPVVAPCRIAAPAALQMAHAFDNALRGHQAVDAISVTQLTVSGNGRIRQAIEAQLRYAEEQASRIRSLRQLLEDVQEPTQGESDVV